MSIKEIREEQAWRDEAYRLRDRIRDLEAQAVAAAEKLAYVEGQRDQAREEVERLQKQSASWAAGAGLTSGVLDDIERRFGSIDKAMDAWDEVERQRQRRELADEAYLNAANDRDEAVRLLREVVHEAECDGDTPAGCYLVDYKAIDDAERFLEQQDA